MGQRINPHSLRVGLMRDWESTWYDEPEEEVLVEKYSFIEKLKAAFLRFYIELIITL